MAAVVPYLQGRHLTSVTCKGLTKAADGTLTVAVTKTLTTLTSELDFQSTPTKSDIGPVNATGQNMVIEDDGSQLSMAVLMLSSGENALATLYTSYDYLLFEWTRGGQAYAFYSSRGDFGDTINSRGANFQRVTADRADISSTNPTYT